jgi:Dolichyl-phosphate-mannose-protein mannosyltransferase
MRFGLPIAIATPLLLFVALPPLSKNGLWDPYELDVADLARRIAVNVYGARDLALAGADNSLPHLNDLGRPELAFDSIALGFRTFGLHEWAGRLPLALWATIGVVATFAFVSRLVDARAGLFAALVLTTMPLFFVQAKTMLGDVVSMSAVAMSFGGLVVCVFDRRPSRARAPWLALGLAGLAAGFFSRGGAIGLALPCLGVGVAWAVSWAASDRRRSVDLLGDLLGALCLVAGARVLWQALHVPSGGDVSMWLGAIPHAPRKAPSFEHVVGQLGPALVPWSALVPFALGRLFLAPPACTGADFQRESWTRMAVLCGAAVAFLLHSLLGALTDPIAFSAPAILAAACGIALRDYERGAHPSLATAVGTVAFLGLFHHDFHEMPERAYQTFAVPGAAFPDGFKAHALEVWTVVLVGFAVAAFLTWAERAPARTPFDPATYLRVFRALRSAWDGLLALAFLALVAGASLAGLAVWVAAKTHAPWLPTFSLQMREWVLNAWWIVAFVPLGVVFGLLFACDVWLWAFGRAKRLSFASFTRGLEPFEELADRVLGKRATPADERLISAAVLVPLMVLAFPAGVVAALVAGGVRAATAVAFGLPSGVALFVALGVAGDALRGSRAAFLPVVGTVTAAVLCLSYYPALAGQLSPKEVFDSYARLHASGEPLALLGVGNRTAAYYAGGQPVTLEDAPRAAEWLSSAPADKRRFLALKADSLPRLNQLHRARTGGNLPIVDGRSSEILLAASSLGGANDENPLARFFLSVPPAPQHPLEVDLDDVLLVLGYDLVDKSGRRVDVLVPGRAYRMRTYYRVLAPTTTEWQAFIHLDGQARRHNGDHKPLEGKYPPPLWSKGDLIVDDHDLTLEPNFTPGSYTLLFGLYFGCGDASCRLKVKSGPSDGAHRINGGLVRVR